MRHRYENKMEHYTCYKGVFTNTTITLMLYKTRPFCTIPSYRCSIYTATNATSNYEMTMLLVF